MQVILSLIEEKLKRKKTEKEGKRKKMEKEGKKEKEKKKKKKNYPQCPTASNRG